jgi:3-oxoadipate enol-lactonase
MYLALLNKHFLEKSQTMPSTKVNDIQIYYELHGAEGKPTVLFLHGLGSSVRDWEFQVPAFADDYRMLLIDMRGHGRSDKQQGPYSMPLFVRDTIALLDQLKIDKVHLVGLSMGGMIAFQMAVDCPERIQSMVIVNSGPAVVPRTMKDRFAIWMRFFIVRVMGMRKMGETLAPRLFVDADQEALRQTFANRWAENDPRAYLDTLRAIVGWTVEDKINQIKIPTLVLCSDMDYTPTADKEKYLVKMSNAKLQILSNAHHAVNAERPELFNEAVRQFIAAHYVFR